MIFHKDYKEHESLRLDQAIRNFLVGSTCTILFLITALVTLPLDVASSGFLVDHVLRLQSITTGSPTIALSQYTILEDISWEGAIFGLSLFLGQILFLHKLAASGKWTNRHETFPKLFFAYLGTLFSGRRWTEPVNSEKGSFLVMFLVLATIDTLSGTMVRGWFGALGWQQLFGAFLFNIFFFTILSEMLLFQAAVWGLNAWANFIFVMLGFVSPALQRGFANLAHSSIDIGLPSDGYMGNSRNGNHKQSQSNSRKNRRGRDGKERIPHSGGAHAHQQRKRESDDLPEELQELRRMMEGSR
jgi:hypothetical protein